MAINPSRQMVTFWLFFFFGGAPRRADGVRSSGKKMVRVKKTVVSDEAVLLAYREKLRSVVPDTSDDWWQTFVEASGRPLRRSISLTERYGGKNPENRVAWCDSGFFVDGEVGLSVEHVTGQFYVQEAAAMLAVSAMVEDFRGEEVVVIDACAAPGGKTVQLCGALRDVKAASILANEVISSRVAALTHNIVRCGLSSQIAVSHADASVILAAAQDSADLVLMDAPCSGDTQSRRSNSSLATQLRRETSPELLAQQKKLLEAAVQAARPDGGKILYSTCSLDPAENEEIVKTVLSDTVHLDPPRIFQAKGISPSPLLEGTARIWPNEHQDTAGFFCARLVREKKTTEKPPVEQKRTLSPFDEAFIIYLRDFWGVDHYELSKTLMRRGADLWLSPDFPFSIKLNRPGAKLLSGLATKGIKIDQDHQLIRALEKGHVKCHHDFALLFGPLSDHTLPLTNRQTLHAYLQGDDLEVPAALCRHTKPGSLLAVTSKNLVLGLAKITHHTDSTLRIKNQLPRDLCRRAVFSPSETTT